MRTHLAWVALSSGVKLKQKVRRMVPSWTPRGSPWRSFWLQCNWRGDARLKLRERAARRLREHPGMQRHFDSLLRRQCRIHRQNRAGDYRHSHNETPERDRAWATSLVDGARCSAFSLRGCIDMFALACAPMRRLKSSCSIRSTAACDVPSSGGTVRTLPGDTTVVLISCRKRLQDKHTRRPRRRQKVPDTG